MTETKDPAAPLLIVTGGPRDGAELPFGEPGEKTLGSSTDCDLSIELGNVEAFHARVSWDFQGLSIVDSGSATGTYVNGERIAGERPLGDGDRVCLGPPGSKGSVKLLVRLPAEASAALETSAPAAADEFSLSSDDGTSAFQPPEAFSLDDEPPPLGADAADIPKLELEAAHEAPPVATAPPPTPPPAPEPAAAVRKPSKPEYNSEMPSIAPTRPRESPTLPPVARETLRVPKAKKPAFDFSQIPRPALIGVPVLLLLVGAWMLYSSSQAPPPVLETVTPGKVETGGTVTIIGKGFTADPAKNVVRFGDQTGTVTAATETQLAVTVPNMDGGDRKVVVESHRSRSNALPLTVFKAPSIAKLEPDVAMPGDEIVATGVNLAGGTLSLFVGSQQVEVQQATPTSFHFRLPQVPGAEGRTISISLQVGPDSAKGTQLILGHLPLIIEVAPATGATGDRVTLRGRGFDPSVSGNAVTFGGQQVLVLSAAANELVVVAPASDRQVPITVQALGHTSSANMSFTVTRASVATFLLRYFAAPALDKPGRDVVFVSTELGPTLMLGGKGDAPSTAERAMRVAAAMNAVADQATSVPVRLEARDKPAGIGIVGSPQLLVAITPEDVAAYPGRLTNKALATFWTALVQDELALFAMRDRPNAVIQMTPHGRVLMEIYAEAVHRSGLGGGVSQSIVSPLSPVRAKDLRDLALLPPAEGQAISAAAVEGSWDGSVEESGVGSKQVQVRLHAKGSQLSGTITSRSGTLTAEVPLSEVSFQGGILSFSLTSGAAPRYFRGTLQGSSISGTVHDKPGAKDSIGQFALTFVD